jgi:hypothetical protein
MRKNEQGKLHCKDGPAVLGENGYKAWYNNGKRQRLNGPAREWSYFDADEWWVNDIEIKIY